MFIPINPVIDFSALAGSRLAFPRPGLFSYARYALIYYLHYLKSLGRGVKTVLVPDYMCAEVCNSLRDEGFSVAFYALEADFDIALPALRQALSAANGAVAVMAAHFYGKTIGNLPEVAAACRERNAVLIEDCVHWPFPFSLAGDFHCDAKLFTLRKVYPVPYGAAIVLRENQDAFAEFVEKTFARRRDFSQAALWAGKQVIKKGLQAAGVRYIAPYRDLSSDPLKSFNFAGTFAERLISSKNYETAVKKRRGNYQTYLAHKDALSRWGKFLAFDAGADVPYKFVIFLKEGMVALDAVKALIAQSVPAVLGLALDDLVEKTMPAGHRYRRVVALPLHQDITRAHIDYIASVLARTTPRTN